MQDMANYLVPFLCGALFLFQSFVAVVVCKTCRWGLRLRLILNSQGLVKWVLNNNATYMVLLMFWYLCWWVYLTDALITCGIIHAMAELYLNCSFAFACIKLFGWFYTDQRGMQGNIIRLQSNFTHWSHWIKMIIFQYHETVINYVLLQEMSFRLSKNFIFEKHVFLCFISLEFATKWEWYALKNRI